MVLRFKLEENLPRDAAALLKNAGHDAATALAEGLGGRSDEALFNACLSEQRILVTLDLDFADIRVHPSTHPGIWILRLEPQSIQAVLDVLRGALALLDVEPAKNRLWILEHDRVRIRD